MSERNRISTTADTGDIRCPFFIAHGKSEIVCEGLIEGSRIKTVFDEPEDKKWHQANYCEKQFGRCELCCSIRHWRWEDD